MEPSQTNEPAQAGIPGRNPLVAMTGQAPVPAPGGQPMGEADDLVWVEKARQVIKRSAGDPYVRHDALVKLKLQYLKQRYGMNIGEDK